MWQSLQIIMMAIRLRALINKGVNVAAVIDTRKQKIDSPDYETFSNSVVSNTNGRLGLYSINIKHEDGTQRTVKCGALGVSGGWNPNIHISSHHRGRPIWNEAIQSFILMIIVQAVCS